MFLKGIAKRVCKRATKEKPMPVTTTIRMPPAPEKDDSSFPKKSNPQINREADVGESDAYDVGRQLVAAAKAHEDFVDQITTLDVELSGAQVELNAKSTADYGDKIIGMTDLSIWTPITDSLTHTT